MLKFFQNLFSAVLALVVLFEEWGWEPLQRLLGRLARLPVVAWLERRIAALSPYAALVVFAAPTVLLLPLKLLGFWLLSHGHAAQAVALIVAGKIVGTAVVARLFVLVKPTLMTLPWFARLYIRWSGWKERIFAVVRASWPWRASRVVKRRAQRVFARWRKVV
jgi:hypothetical protein